MEVIEIDTGKMELNFHLSKLVLFTLSVAWLFAFFVASANQKKTSSYNCLSLHVVDFGGAFSGVLTDELGRVHAVWGSFSTQVFSSLSTSSSELSCRSGI